LNTKDVQSGKGTTTKGSSSQVRKLTVLTQPINSPSYNNNRANIFTADQSAPLFKSTLSPLDMTKSSSARIGFWPNSFSANVHPYSNDIGKSISASTKNSPL